MGKSTEGSPLIEFGESRPEGVQHGIEFNTKRRCLSASTQKGLGRSAPIRQQHIWYGFLSQKRHSVEVSEEDPVHD